MVKDQISAIIAADPVLMRILGIVRSLDLPDWYVGAGAIRNTVWDVLHAKKEKTPFSDVDVVYCDTTNLDGEQDKTICQTLNSVAADVPWQVFNQARAHIYNPRRPMTTSTLQGMTYWIETATCIGVRLEKDNTITIGAPHGVSDLLELRVRPTPPPYTEIDLYLRRVDEKRWDVRWPKLDVYRPSQR